MNVWVIDTDADLPALDGLGYFVLILSIFILLLNLTAYIICKYSWINDGSSNGPISKIFDSFDPVKNWESFKEVPMRAFSFFDGVRALSLLWVVFGHEYFI